MVEKRDLLLINEEKVIEAEDVVEEQQIKAKEVLFHINVWFMEITNAYLI